jgi:hypothetical protein
MRIVPEVTLFAAFAWSWLVAYTVLECMSWVSPAVALKVNVIGPALVSGKLFGEKKTQPKIEATTTITATIIA